MNYLNLSFHDLMQLPTFATAVKADDKAATSEVLWQAGIDTSQPYELVKCLHRALTTNIPVDDYLVMGVGRTDDEHIHSGFARVEDVIASTKDISLREGLRSMRSNPSLSDVMMYSGESLPEAVDLLDDPVTDKDIEDMVVKLFNEGDCV